MSKNIPIQQPKFELKRKFINYSQVFYQKENIVRDLLLYYDNMGSKIQEHKKLISNQNYETFINFSDAKIDQQRQQMQQSSMKIIQALIEIVQNLNHDRQLMMYVLPTIDGILFDERSYIKLILRIFEDQPEDKKLVNVLKKFLVLENYDQVVYDSAARILSFIYGELDRKLYEQQQKEFMLFILNMKEKPNAQQKIKIGNYPMVLCLVNLLKYNHLITTFLDNKGIEIISDNLERFSHDLQYSYYTFLVLWLISFHEKSIEYFKDPTLRLIGLIIEVIQKIGREKLVRVGFQCFRTLCGKSQDCIEIMVDGNLLKVIDTLLKGNIKDNQTLDDIKSVGEIMEQNIKILTSFEKYEKELNRGYFDWSPVHSEKFWKENVKRFEDDDFKMIKKLITFLDTNNKKNVAIACFDLGEFCRFHPFGKTVLESLKAKDKIVIKAKSDDSSIREQALLALQKIMLHNWQAVNK